MRIIPAIDIIDGKCVRLTKGDYATQKIYNENPLEVAKAFEDNGLHYLHLVDLDGAKAKRTINYPILEKIASKTSLKIDFSGGLRSDEDLNIAFGNGANQVSIGSVAAQNPKLFLGWLLQFGAEKIILSADVKDGQIATSGWLENSNLDAVKFIQSFENEGVKYVACTDISKDGMLEGSSEEFYQSILKKSNISLIASGGVSNLQDIINLKNIGCEGVIIGKAIYENKISLKELSLC